jgi:hypothetical protein
MSSREPPHIPAGAEWYLAEIDHLDAKLRASMEQAGVLRPVRSRKRRALVGKGKSRR